MPFIANNVQKPQGEHKKDTSTTIFCSRVNSASSLNLLDLCCTVCEHLYYFASVKTIREVSHTSIGGSLIDQDKCLIKNFFQQLLQRAD